MCWTRFLKNTILTLKLTMMDVQEQMMRMAAKGKGARI
jgi:hypothetical protein